MIASVLASQGLGREKIARPAACMRARKDEPPSPDENREEGFSLSWPAPRGQGYTVPQYRQKRKWYSALLGLVACFLPAFFYGENIVLYGAAIA